MMRNRLASAASIAAVVLFGCGAAAWSGSLTITDHHKAPLGDYLTDGQGRTMYVFTADKHGGSACDDACAKAWPPVITDGAVMFGGDVKPSDLDTIKRGKQRQATYNGMPLYFFARDKSSGSLAGEGIKHFGGTWYVVSPDGHPILPNGKKLRG